MRGLLVLEDGSVYEGKIFGAVQETYGEVVFNTGMTGYQEVLTDPSYAGQIVTMTYPLIGNYGLNQEDQESAVPQVRGFIVKEACPWASNWRAEMELDAYLKSHGIVALAGIDTRALTKRLRNHGTMRGIISPGGGVMELQQRAAEVPFISGRDLVSRVTCREPFYVPGEGPRVALLDLGAKTNILRSLVRRGCAVHVLPAHTKAAEILALEPDGIMLSNGPGDPTDVPYAIATVAELAGKKPIFGICLGHQVLALALGAKTYKLKFGHRGVNHPVKDLTTGRVYITSQNHGFAVDERSLAGTGLAVSHINLNDGTVEGLRHESLPVATVQYHPEAAPGPEDSAYLFDDFIAVLHQGGKNNAQA